ncbi:MAG: DNA polymerase II [Candidatus Hecatellales archaeon]|nr:MAG: DNA polymerase II [Candidatus Hecatellales archaeon]
MKVRFWLLDISQEPAGETSEIRLWGVDRKGRRILILDRGFNPSLYVAPKIEAEEAVKSLNSNPTLRQAFSTVEVEEKKLFGKPLKVLRVEAKGQEAFETLAKKLPREGWVGEVFHDDLRASSQYLLSLDVKPCGWNEVEAEEVKPPGGVRVEACYLAKERPRAVEALETPKLRVLAFTPIYSSEIGSPSPLRDPVLAIAAVTSQGERKVFAASEKGDDKGLLEEFSRYVEAYDPDVVVGYGSNRQDYPYLTQRAEKLGVRFRMDRMGQHPHQSLYGHFSVVGRANIDLLDFAEDMPEVKLKTLANVASFLGVKFEEPIEVDAVEAGRLWKTEEGREKLQALCLRRAEVIMGVAEAILDFAYQLSHLIGMPVDQVGAAAVGFRVDWYLIREAWRLGELAPKRVEQPYYPYKGGMVLEPKAGIHEKVAVFDFTSMYPSLMVKYNLSPDTYLPEGEPEPEEGVYVAPEVGHRFRKKPPGFYKMVLEELMRARRQIRQRMKGLKPSQALYRILDARQRSVKVITNAVYGYSGWRGARWFKAEVAEAVAAWGRKTISEALAIAEKLGLKVIYGDTDSVFLAYEPEKVERFEAEVEKRVGLEIKPDAIYERILFTEAKKRYAGLLPDGRVEIVGLEVARGDWCEAAKQVQEKVIEIVLREGDPGKAVEYVRQWIRDFKAGRFSMEDVTIWKTITKPIEDYEVRAPHVEAAKRLMAKGWKLTYGDKVGYVIVKGAGKLYQRAEPSLTASPADVDLDYYVENQVVPAALRILQIFGITKNHLMEGLPAKKEGLLKFFS